MATIDVKNISELAAALVPDNADATINVAAGDYTIEQTLVVPRGAALIGIGVMNAVYRAGGMNPDLPQSRLKAAPALAGDMLRLNDGASLKGLTIEDVAGRTGNLVAVTSSKPGDRVSAQIESCELVNPNPSGAQPSGPVGRSLLVVTRNPDDGSTLSVCVRRSAIRSPANGSGVFAINFAPRSRIFLELSRNRIGGGLDANGGVSRPIPVTGSDTRILSDRNLYIFDGTGGAEGTGWLLHGGSNPPVPFFAPAYTRGNSLSMRSYRDSISGFQIGILAGGGWRPLESGGPVSYNCADIDLDNIAISVPGPRFMFTGAKAGVDGDTFAPGDDNRLRVTGTPFWTDGQSPVPELDDCLFRHAATASGAELPDPGTGNRLELYGIKFEGGQVGYLEEYYCGPRFEASGP